MKTKEETVLNMYKNSFFKNRHKLNWRVPIVCDAVYRTFKFKNIVDVGCATADFLEGFQKRGKQIFGIEGSEAAIEHMKIDQKYIQIADLRNNFKVIGHRFDLAISLEVAEHIESDYTDNYISTLINLSDTILITAAPPGQKGHYHVNCQESDYWVERFKQKGYDFDKTTTQKFKKELEIYKSKKGINCYYNNCLVFRRNGWNRRS